MAQLVKGWMELQEISDSNLYKNIVLQRIMQMNISKQIKGICLNFLKIVHIII